MEISIEQRESQLGWKLIAPCIGVIGILIIYPILYNIYLSFFDVKLTGEKIFIGIANYERLLKDTAFYGSLLTTIIYLLGTVVGSTLMGLFVALLMNIKFPLRNAARTIILLPYFAPVISVVFGWQFIFDPVNGIYNHVVVELLHLTGHRHNLIGDPKTALMVVILFDIWKHFPISYLLIISKLQSINRDQYEAAAIDGCGPIGRFFHVTLPEIYFVLGTLVILRLIWNLNKFEEVFLLAPNVQTLPIFTYYAAFTGIIDQGFAASISVVQFLILSFLIFFYVKKVLKW
ncbi:MAG: sugar ABC transporter permease [Deltaproteobacteria bacterium]|nr:sugar ABC transporter permease [Deltaproteobacteria bacterium]MBW1912724.1 sugar ABC transporter permease [Deltaproteobacteria bacterium]